MIFQSAEDCVVLIVFSMAAGGRETGFVDSLGLVVRGFFKGISVFVAKRRTPHYKYIRIQLIQNKL